MKFKINYLAMVCTVSIAVAIVGCSSEQNTKVSTSNADHEVKNVILMIGDGMGLAQVSAARFASKAPLNIEKAEFVGLMGTTNAKGQITDSAAAATAFAIGEKTVNEAIGVNTSGKSKETILETVAKDGFATGLIATSAITHATPASFYAHVENRDNAYKIAEWLAKAPVNLFIGGGQDYFDQRTDDSRGKPDSRNLVTEMKSRGVHVVDSLKALSNKKGRAAMFIADGHPEPVSEGRGDILVRSIKPSIDYLQKNSEKGFFLMVEGAQIDWGGHQNDFGYMLSELLDFDKAVGQALEFAAKDGNTLVIVTADHETGGLTLPMQNSSLELAKPDQHMPQQDLTPRANHSTNSHTAIMVPVYAFGKGAKEFAGVYENSELHSKLLSAFSE